MMKAGRMPLLRMAWFAAAIVASLGCESAPDLEHVELYEKDGVSFRLPGNWEVSKDETRSGKAEARILFIESPGNPLFMIQRFRPAREESLEEYASWFVETMIEKAGSVGGVGPLKPFEARAGEWGRVRSPVGETEREGVEIGLTISLLGQQVPHRIRLFQVQTTDATYYLVLQASTEDWDLVEPGFALIAGSLALR